MDPSDLVCEDDEEEGGSDESDEEDVVCGTNGETYSSVCRLLQDTGNEQVAYAGDCDREECDGGPVSPFFLPSTNQTSESAYSSLLQCTASSKLLYYYTIASCEPHLSIDDVANNSIACTPGMWY